VKLAVVVQRYGSAINGGAEAHARYIAEHLARHADVEVMTTCALDYLTWRNELPAGREEVNGVPVRRFPVAHPRDPQKFARLSVHVFERPHSIGDELRWLDAEGPTSPALVKYIRAHEHEHDFWIFFSYRYYQSYHGARAAAPRAVLVPTAERDSTIGVSIFAPLFRGVRALMYNSHEERAMIEAVAGNEGVPAVVVGVGSQIPADPQAGRFRQKFGIAGPFVVFVGRVDPNKGCDELFRYVERYVSGGSRFSLVVIGKPLMAIPDHPSIRHLGFLDDQDKYDAIAAADALIIPSPYESLSMVTLEAWALGKPVLANGRCDVLKGQCLRSNAGLFYDNYQEFAGALRMLEERRDVAAALGDNGRRFFREHYAWPVIERKYLDMFDRLKREPPSPPMEPLPNWLERRRVDRRPAIELVDRIPVGPVRPAASTGGEPRLQEMAR